MQVTPAKAGVHLRGRQGRRRVGATAEGIELLPALGFMIRLEKGKDRFRVSLGTSWIWMPS
jgi:hypothetical protein